MLTRAGAAQNETLERLKHLLGGRKILFTLVGSAACREYGLSRTANDLGDSLKALKSPSIFPPREKTTGSIWVNGRSESTPSNPNNPETPHHRDGIIDRKDFVRQPNFLRLHTLKSRLDNSLPGSILLLLSRTYDLPVP